MNATIIARSPLHWAVYIDKEYRGTVDSSKDALQVAYNIGANTFGIKDEKGEILAVNRQEVANSFARNAK